MEAIGDYRLVRAVGGGRHGKVYEAEGRLSGRHVALEVLRPELAKLTVGAAPVHERDERSSPSWITRTSFARSRSAKSRTSS